MVSWVFAPSCLYVHLYLLGSTYLIHGTCHRFENPMEIICWIYASSYEFRLVSMGILPSPSEASVTIWMPDPMVASRPQLT
ncbi:hypothetical protein GY45DRAFT_892744 [Cubamyces sp. BRFM 1775]|nr:hypothetical protein GY45DRAFT_892744 [Cubamyces sp. BRFM 1775]